MKAEPTMLHPSLERATTSDVSERERIDYWEALNASVLTGVRCSTHDPTGLNASATRREFPELSLSLIEGNQHVVERTLDIARQQPKNALFACLLMEGTAFFYQKNNCLLLAAGDMLLYDAEEPFLYGFTGPMKQLIIDIPRSGGLRDTHPSSPLRIDGQLGLGRTTAGAIGRSGLSLLRNGDAAQVDAVRSLITGLINPAQRSRRSHILPLIKAKKFISENLAAPDLGPEAVSAHLGITTRHLNRLFALESTTAGEFIRNERLNMIHGELKSSMGANATIGEIAYRWGFRDLAHFTRAFRRRYGTTPSVVRGR